MRTYLIRRLVLFVPTFLGVSVFIFLMLHTIPGDYATSLMLADEEAGGTFTQEDLDRVRSNLGLDGPCHRYTRCVCHTVLFGNAD